MGKKIKKDVENHPKNEFNTICIETKAPATVAMLLKCEEEDVLQRAAEAIYKFADRSDENKATLLHLGVLEGLVPLIGHEDKYVKRYACMAFGIMSSHAEARKRIRRTMQLNTVINLLGDEDDVCIEFCSLALANLAKDFASKVMIIQQNGIQSLVNLLSSPDPDIQHNVLAALKNLVEDFNGRSTVRSFGGVTPLIRLLDSEYPVLQDLSLKVLLSISKDGPSRVILRIEGGLEKLVNVLENKEMQDVHVSTLGVLCNCLTDNETLEDIRCTRVLDRILSFVANGDVPEETQAAALKALSRVFRKHENARIFHEELIEDRLLTLCTRENEEIVIAACQAIAALADYGPSRIHFGKLEGFSHVVALTASENRTINEAACAAVANLTLYNAPNSREVVLCGGVEYLLMNLNLEKGQVLSNTLTALINMSKDIRIRNEIGRRGIIKGLISALKTDNPAIQSKTCEALSTYINSTESRSEVRDCAGLRPILSLIDSSNIAVRRKAAQAIIQCVDRTNADRIATMGGLKVLHDVITSETLRSNASLTAYDKILDHNLSAKYALVGNLSSRNMIDVLFYDNGREKSSYNMITLQEINRSLMPWSQSCLLVHTSPHPAAAVKKPESSSRKGARSRQPSGSRPGTNSPTNRRERSAEPSNVKSVELESPPPPSPDMQGVTISKNTAARKKRDKEAAAAAEAERLKMEKEGDAYRPPMDNDLLTYIEEVRQHILPIPNTQEQIIALAQYVSDRMGGPVPKDKLLEFPWQLHLAELKHELKSNIIPIGKIRSGIHIHRALLYKVLADKLGMPCTLVRGDYNRAWNEIRYAATQDNSTANYAPSLYVLDLMHDPGSLLRTDSAEAVLYKSI